MNPLHSDLLASHKDLATSPPRPANTLTSSRGDATMTSHSDRYCDSVFEHVASQRLRELEVSTASLGCRMITPRCCISGDDDQAEQDKESMLTEEIAFEEFIWWWKDTVGYKGEMKFREIANLIRGYTGEGDPVQQWTTLTSTDEDFVQLQRSWSDERQDKLNEKKAEIIKPIRDMITEKIGFPFSDAQLEWLLSAVAKSGEPGETDATREEADGIGDKSFCGVCEVAKLWDDHVREDTHDSIDRSGVVNLLKKMNVDAWNVNVFKFKTTIQVADDKQHTDGKIQHKRCKVFGAWLRTNFCTKECGIVYVMILAATFALLRLWLGRLEVTAYGACGAVPVLFEQTMEYQTVFAWGVTPPYFCTMADCFCLAQLRRVAAGSNQKRILSLSSRKEDMPVWWLEEIRSVFNPAPMEPLFFWVGFVGFYGVHQSATGIGYFIVFNTFYFCVACVGAFWRTITLRYQRSHIIQYLGPSPPWSYAFKAMILGWIIQAPITTHILLRDSYILNDDFASLTSDDDVNCTAATAIYQQCVAESGQSQDAMVLGRYHDPVVKDNAFCSVTLSIGVMCLLYYTPLVFLMLDGPGLLTQLRMNKIAKVDECKCQVCVGRDNPSQAQVIPPPCWVAFEKMCAGCTAIGMAIFLAGNVTWIVYSLGIGNFCSNEMSLKWVLFFGGNLFSMWLICFVAFPQTMINIYQAYATRPPKDCLAKWLYKPMLGCILQTFKWDLKNFDYSGVVRSEVASVPWVFVSSPEFAPADESWTAVKVMDHLEELCKAYPTYFYQGFDWASSGNSYPEDNPLWNQMGSIKPPRTGLQGQWGAAGETDFIQRGKGYTDFMELCEGNLKTLSAEGVEEILDAMQTEQNEDIQIAVKAKVIELMAPILVKTQWFKSYRGKVQGALQAACQKSIFKYTCPECGTIRNTGRCKAVLIGGGPVSRVEDYMMKEICNNVNVRGLDVRLKDVGIKRFDSVESMLHVAAEQIQCV